MLWQHITAGILIACDETPFSVKGLKHLVYTGELHLSGLIGTVSYPDMQQIQIIGFFFENRLHWQCELWLLLFTVCTCVQNIHLRLI
jgi:hypothetical protein